MVEKNNTNKMLTIGLVIIIAIAAIVLIYVNLPQQDKTNQDTKNNKEKETPNISLNISYEEQKLQYTLEDMEKMENTSGTARYLKASPFFSSGTIIIIPPTNESANQYTGVKISKIIENIENLPETYNVTVSAPDGYSTTFNYTEINGNMITYNETGNQSFNEISVIIAYKKDGEYIERT